MTEPQSDEKSAGGARLDLARWASPVFDRSRYSAAVNWARAHWCSMAGGTIKWVVILAIFVPPIWVGFYTHSPLPATRLMHERAATGIAVEHIWLPLEDISPHLRRAVIASEDTNFCQHFGIDLKELWSILNAPSQDRRRGASTITQQTAKNVFLWHERSYIRKGLEFYFALLEELTWSKSRIMEVYLNVAEWGDGRFGAEAAARHYFKKSAKDLTRHEASRLAVVLPNPNRWRANPAGPYVLRRSGTIRARMTFIRRNGLDQCVLKDEPG